MSRDYSSASSWVLEVLGPRGDVRHSWPIQPGSGLLGRGAHCTYRVDDPDRLLSREHAVLECLNGQVYWTQRGGNPTERAGTPLPEGARTRLTDGDELLAGQCLFRLREQALADVAWHAPVNVQPEADPLAWLDSLDPHAPKNVMSLDDLLGPGMPAQAAPPVRSADPIPQHALNHQIPRAAPSTVSDLIAAEPAPATEIKDPFKDRFADESLKQCLDLILKLIALRRALRIELGTSHTVIQPRQNNPLKFAASVDHLMALLPQGAGNAPYMPLNQALNEVSNELLAHQSLVLEGLRTLLNRLDQTLSPRALEAQVPDEGLMGLPLASRRKAQLWDAYCTQYSLLNGLTGEPFGALVRQVFSTLLEPGEPS